MTGFDVRQIRIFVTVAELLSFTRAAERLNMAQPWLSVQIRKLEDQLGFMLFQRNRKQAVTLSPRGTAFLPAAQSFLAAYDQLTGEAIAIRDQQMLTLSIGAPEYTADIAERGQLVDAVQKAFPDIEIDIVNALSLGLIDQLRSGMLDISFAFGPLPTDGLDTLVVRRWGIALLMPADDPLAARREIPMHLLRNRCIGMIRRKFNPHLYDYIGHALERAGATIQTMPEASPGGVRRFAASAQVPVIVSGWWTILPGQMDLVVRPIVDPVLTMELLLLRRRGDRRQPVALMWDMAQAMADT